MILLIDADDTLWENNVYFERVIERFIAHLNHAHLNHAHLNHAHLNHEHLTPAEVREVINEIEHANAQTHGYGTESFTRNLRTAYERLAARIDDDWEWLHSLTRTITDHEMELIDGVRETLEYLRPRHHLVLFTKGNHAEQTSKTSRSGLAPLFHDIRVVKEKNAAAYEHMAAELGAPKPEIWMIGNSPRSDINPALAAGLNAVFIPHHATWVLEHEEVPESHTRLKTLSRFADLREHF